LINAWSSSVIVFVEESAEPVAPADVELCQRGGFGDRVGQEP
jgi:hypothetical protein